MTNQRAGTYKWRRVVPSAVVLPLLVMLGCTGQRAKESKSPVPNANVSVNLNYSMDGLHSSLPVGDNKELTVGTSVGNYDDVEVTVSSIQPVGEDGLRLEPWRMVGAERNNGGYHVDVAFPPVRSWPESSERPFAPFVLSVGDEDGVVALFKTILTSEFASFYGFSVVGVRDGVEFKDYVWAPTVFCSSEEDTPECFEFSEEVARSAEQYFEAAGYVREIGG